jgi:hypothetical protein
MQGSGLITDCLCIAGHEGTITSEDSECTECGLGRWKAGSGTAECTECPSDSNTSGPGSEQRSDCLCNAGFNGTIDGPASACDACEIGTYKSDPGTDDCDDCPNDATTEGEAATEISLCLCEAGHTGTITAPASSCSSCDIATYKVELGPSGCLNCPDSPFSTTEGEASTNVTDCLCIAGREGEIDGAGATCAACELGRWKGSVGADDCAPQGC